MTQAVFMSPNFNERNRAIPLCYIVIHYTGTKNAEEALSVYRDPSSELSAHYFIDRDGQTVALVPDEKRAWHAGRSSWHGIRDMNSASLGIELLNPGHEFGYHDFPSLQIEALKKLLFDLTKRHNLNPRTALLGHSDIAPDRKLDPGELFPWKELADCGLGLWPKPEPADFTTGNAPEALAHLSSIGYGTDSFKTTDFLPDKTVDFGQIILAFQRHYNPANLTGELDRETMARLRALARAYKSS